MYKQLLSSNIYLLNLWKNSIGSAVPAVQILNLLSSLEGAEIWLVSSGCHMQIIRPIGRGSVVVGGIWEVLCWQHQNFIVLGGGERKHRLLNITCQLGLPHL